MLGDVRPAAASQFGRLVLVAVGNEQGVGHVPAGYRVDRGCPLGGVGRTIPNGNADTADVTREETRLPRNLNGCAALESPSL